MQTSFDVINIYLLVPLDEAVAVIIDILKNVIDDLLKQKERTLTDIHELIELCSSVDYFIFA